MRTPSFEKYLAKLHQEAADRIAKIGPVEDIAIVKHETDTRWQMILADVSGGTVWRTQTFDLNGFSGHSLFKDKAEAINDAAQSRYTLRDDGALDRIQDTPEFQIGLYAAEQIRLVNMRQLAFAEYDKRMEAYRQQCFGVRRSSLICCQS